jgi:hypothetical protein
MRAPAWVTALAVSALVGCSEDEQRPATEGTTPPLYGCTYVAEDDFCYCSDGKSPTAPGSFPPSSCKGTCCFVDDRNDCNCYGVKQPGSACTGLVASQRQVDSCQYSHAVSDPIDAGTSCSNPGQPCKKDPDCCSGLTCANNIKDNSSLCVRLTGLEAGVCGLFDVECAQVKACCEGLVCRNDGKCGTTSGN